MREIRIPINYLAIAMVFLLIGSAVGYTAKGNSPPTNGFECPAEMQLTTADQNLIINAGLIGDCEKLGLQTSIMIQDFNGTPYGVPICVEAAT